MISDAGSSASAATLMGVPSLELADLATGLLAVVTDLATGAFATGALATGVRLTAGFVTTTRAAGALATGASASSATSSAAISSDRDSSLTTGDLAATADLLTGGFAAAVTRALATGASTRSISGAAFGSALVRNQKRRHPLPLPGPMRGLRKILASPVQGLGRSFRLWGGLDRDASAGASFALVANVFSSASSSASSAASQHRGPHPVRFRRAELSGRSGWSRRRTGRHGRDWLLGNWLLIEHIGERRRLAWRRCGRIRRSTGPLGGDF